MWYVFQALTKCPRSLNSNFVPCTHITHQMWHTSHIIITPTNTSINPHINVYSPLKSSWVRCVSTDNDIGVDGVRALSQCLQHVPHLTQLNLSGEYTLMCGLIDVLVGVILMCDVWCVMCDVWVQITKLELRERRHWVSACNTCHILFNSTWLVSVYWCVHWCVNWCDIDVC